MTIIYNNAKDAVAVSKRIAEIGGGVVVVEDSKVIDEVSFPIRCV